MDFVLKHRNQWTMSTACQYRKIDERSLSLFACIHRCDAWWIINKWSSCIFFKFQIHVIFRRPCQCQCWLTYITQCVRESSFYRFKSNQLQRYGHRTWCSIVSIIRFNYISKYCVMIRPELPLPLPYSKANIEMWLWYGSQLAITSFWSRRCVKISGSLPRLPIATVWTV